MRDRGRRGGDRGAGGVLARQQVPRPGDDGTVLPILHLNGYKIANPTVLARIPDSELRALLAGYGHEPFFIEVDAGDDPMAAATLDRAPPVGDDQQIALMMGDVGPWLGEAHIYRVTTSEQGRVFGRYTVVVVG